MKFAISRGTSRDFLLTFASGCGIITVLKEQMNKGVQTMLYFRCVKNVKQGAELIRELKNDFDKKSLLTNIGGNLVVVTEFDSNKMCERLTKLVNGVEYDIMFGQLLPDEAEQCNFNSLPIVTSDFDTMNIDINEVSGHMSKKLQMATFGRYFGKMTIIVDFKRQRVHTLRVICFGTDMDEQVYTFAEIFG